MYVVISRQSGQFMLQFFRFPEDMRRKCRDHERTWLAQNVAQNYRRFKKKLPEFVE